MFQEEIKKFLYNEDIDNSIARLRDAHDGLEENEKELIYNYAEEVNEKLKTNNVENLDLVYSVDLMYHLLSYEEEIVAERFKNKLLDSINVEDGNYIQ